MIATFSIQYLIHHNKGTLGFKHVEKIYNFVIAVWHTNSRSPKTQFLYVRYQNLLVLRLIGFEGYKNGLTLGQSGFFWFWKRSILNKCRMYKQQKHVQIKFKRWSGFGYRRKSRGNMPHAQEEQSLMGIHNLRRITEVMLLRIKFQGIQTDIFLHNHTTSK